MFIHNFQTILGIVLILSHFPTKILTMALFIKKTIANVLPWQPLIDQ